LAKKKSPDEEIRRGLEALQQAGLTFDNAGTATLPSLEQEFGKAEHTDLAIVFVLGKIADPAAVTTLLRIEKKARDKNLKKEIRRSLFKLSQKGVTIPEDKSGEEKPPIFTLARTSDIEAYMSAVDGAGGRLLWIVKPQPGHGLQTIQAMTNDREGLQRVGGAQVRRKELRNMAHEIKKQHGITMIAVPWEYADSMLYESFEKSKAAGRSGLEKFHELRSVIGTGKPKAQEHPIYRRLHSEDVRQGAWRELSRRLLDEPEFRFWILDADWLAPFLGQLQDAQTSRLVLNPMQKEERLAAIVRDTVKMLFAGEAGKIMQRRLEDMALYLLETARTEPAKLALAVAAQIQDGDPGPLDISFLTGLAQKSFAFQMSQQKSKAEEEPSFIVKP
jgi:hypothetical protein